MGSLRESLFLTVWLKRQEIEVMKQQVIASGFGDLLMGQSTKTTAEAYKKFIDAIFPFAAKTRSNTDEKMVQAMRQEAAKGPITFSPINTPNPLQKAARQMRLPDEFRQKLQTRARGRLK